MEIVQQFNAELSSLYDVKPPISKAKMSQITRVSMKGVKMYKHIVQSVERFIVKCRPEYKIPGLYVIDSIVRQSRHQFGIDKDVFAPRFARNFGITFQNLFITCPSDDKPKIVRVLNLWQRNNVFSAETIQPLLDMANPNASLTQIKYESSVSPPISAASTVRESRDRDSHRNDSREHEMNSSLKDNALMLQLQHLANTLGLSKSGSTEGHSSSGHLHQIQEPSNSNVKFNKKLLDFDYDDDDDDERNETPTEAEPPMRQYHHATAEEDQEQVTNPLALHMAHNLLSNPELLQQLQKMHHSIQQNPSEFLNRSELEINNSESGNLNLNQLNAAVAAAVAAQSQGSSSSSSAAFSASVFQTSVNDSKNHKENQLSQNFAFNSEVISDLHNQMQNQLQNQSQSIVTHNQSHDLNTNTNISLYQSNAPVFVNSAPNLAHSRGANEQTNHMSGSNYQVNSFEGHQQFHQHGHHQQYHHQQQHQGYHNQQRDGNFTDEHYPGNFEQRSGSRSPRSRSRSPRRALRGFERRDSRFRERSRSPRNRRGDRGGDRGGDRERGGERRNDAREGRDARYRSRSRSPRKSSRFDRSNDAQSQRVRSPASYEMEKERERRRRGLPPIRKGHLTICSTTLWLGHVPKLVSEADLSDAFGEYGTITSIDLIPPRGCAYVCMNRRQDASKALHHLKNMKLHGNTIKMAWAPGKGMKGKEYKDYWEVDHGASYIPYERIRGDVDLDILEEGGMIDDDTIPEKLQELRKIKAKEKEEKEREAATAAMMANAALMQMPIPLTNATFSVPGMVMSNLIISAGQATGPPVPVVTSATTITSIPMSIPAPPPQNNVVTDVKISLSDIKDKLSNESHHETVSLPNSALLPPPLPPFQSVPQQLNQFPPPPPPPSAIGQPSQHMPWLSGPPPPILGPPPGVSSGVRPPLISTPPLVPMSTISSVLSTASAVTTSAFAHELQSRVSNMENSRPPLISTLPMPLPHDDHLHSRLHSDRFNPRDRYNRGHRGASPPMGQSIDDDPFAPSVYELRAMGRAANAPLLARPPPGPAGHTPHHHNIQGHSSGGRPLLSNMSQIHDRYPYDSSNQRPSGRSFNNREWGGQHRGQHQNSGRGYHSERVRGSGRRERQSRWKNDNYNSNNNNYNNFNANSQIGSQIPPESVKHEPSSSLSDINNDDVSDLQENTDEFSVNDNNNGVIPEDDNQINDRECENIKKEHSEVKSENLENNNLDESSLQL